jgi:hypothetical protein
MIDHMLRPPRGFEDVVRLHFKLRRDAIMAHIDKWLAMCRERRGRCAASLLACLRSLQALPLARPCQPCTSPLARLLGHATCCGCRASPGLLAGWLAGWLAAPAAWCILQCWEAGSCFCGGKSAPIFLTIALHRHSTSQAQLEAHKKQLAELIDKL